MEPAQRALSSSCPTSCLAWRGARCLQTPHRHRAVRDSPRCCGSWHVTRGPGLQTGGQEYVTENPQNDKKRARSTRNCSSFLGRCLVFLFLPFSPAPQKEFVAVS